MKIELLNVRIFISKNTVVTDAIGNHRNEWQPFYTCYATASGEAGKEQTDALIAFVVIDYITGVMCAIINRELSSAVGFKGIFRKVLIFLLVGIANIIDVQVIGTGAVLRTAVIFFYISNEGVSLLENAGHLGLPIPEKIKTVLEQLHDRAENGKEGNE